MTDIGIEVREILMDAYMKIETIRDASKEDITERITLNALSVVLDNWIMRLEEMVGRRV